MAVQTFGNRILGGVGAPGGGMSETFAAGVNTALGQRSTRQDMRLRDIDLQWKTEDREEAKRRRAAAAAEAAATRATNKAALAGIATAQPFFRIGAQQPPAAGAVVPGAPSARQSGVSIPLNMGTRAPAAPTAAGVNISGGAGSGSTSGGAGSSSISGGAGTDQLGGGTGTDQLVVPSWADERIYANVVDPNAPQFAQTVTGIFRKGDISREVERITRGLLNGDYGLSAGTVGGMVGYFTDSPTDAARRQALTDALDWFQSSEADAIFQKTPKLLYDARLDPVGFAARFKGGAAPGKPPVTAADTIRATEFFTPTQTVTIQGPNGPMTVPVENMGGDAMRFPPAGVRPPEPAPAPYQPVSDYTLGFGAGVGGMDQPTEQAVTFGERLGAAPTPTEMFFADIGRTPAGNVDLPALVSKQDSPVFDPNFSAIAEQERALYAYAAQDAMNKGDLNGYMTAVSKVRELETMILSQQLMLGVNEATNFNSAQRLSAVASMVYGGADVVIIPKGNGIGDIYMNGQLSQSNANLAGMGDEMLRTIDANYRAQAAAAEAERAGTVFETDEAIRQQTAIDTNKAALEADQKAFDMALAIEQDLGTKLNDVQVEQLKATLIASGKLPGPAADYTYTKLGEDTVLVTSNGQQVATFQLTVQDTAAGPQPVIVEIGG